MSRRKHLPVDFIGIGAPKAGTTWLWHVLRQHPQIFLPDSKEIYYFNSESYDDPSIANPRHRRSAEWYRSLFEAARPNQLRGEITPLYLSSPGAAQAIIRLVPQVLLFAVLRDPAERAYSDYLYRRRRGTIPAGWDFEAALERDPTLIERGKYGAQLQAYLRVVPLEQMHLMAFDDICADPQIVIDGLLDFLGVDRTPLQDLRQVVNRAGEARYPHFNRMVAIGRRWARRWRMETLIDRVGSTRVGDTLRSWRRASSEGAPVEPPERLLAELAREYTADLHLLRGLTGWDIDRWQHRSRAGRR